MKILRIVSSGYEEGGAENGIVLMKPLFEERGHIVKVFSSDSRSDLPHFNDYSYKSPTEGFLGRFMYSANFYAYFQLKKVLKEFNPDIVNVHTIGNASPLILLALKNYPSVYTVHGPEFFVKSLRLWCFPKNYFKSNEFTFDNLTLAGKFRYLFMTIFDMNIFKAGLKNINIFITLSGYMNRLLVKDGINNTLVPYGTRLMKYSPLNIEEIKNNLLYVGRLESYKGVDYLIKSMPEILEKFPDTKLKIAGQGSEKSNLEALVKSLSLENNVVFLGQMSRAQLEEEYVKCSVLVVPSVWDEAFGKIGVEAMSVGRPVVATDVGGISDWLKDGENGFLVSPKNSEKISESIIKIFSNHDTLIKMSEKARKISESFDLSVHVKKMEEIYQDLINSRRQKQKI